MIKIWNRISNIGIHSNLTLFEKKRILLTNRLGIISSLIGVLAFFIHLFLGNAINILHAVLIILLTLPTLYFNSIRLYRTGSYVLVSSGLLLLIAHTMLYGWEGGANYIMVYIFFTVLIVFTKNRDYWIMGLLHILVFIICKYISLNFPPLFQIPSIEIGSYVFLFALTYLNVSLFKSEQAEAEGNTESLIEAIENKNKALETQRSLVKYQNQALKKANEELEETEKSLKESVEDLRTFAYIVSHDLKEPLRMINSYTQLIKRRLHGKLDEETEEFMFYIVDGAKRMKDLLDDLLKYATTTNKEVEREDFPLKDAFDVVLMNLEFQIEESKTDIYLEEDKLPIIHAPFSQITQLFQNLLTNAIKFHKPDQVPTVMVRSKTNDRYHIISIQDLGIGIPRDKTDSIFSPFKRVGNKEKYKGSGIGLAICKKIVQNLDGKIWVESELGEGATFYIAFPIKKRLKKKGE